VRRSGPPGLDSLARRCCPLAPAIAPNGHQYCRIIAF
jgi:hypothetical protein